MPSSNSPWALEAARERRLRIAAQSGRTSTNLAGTRSFVNTYLGGTQ